MDKWIVTYEKYSKAVELIYASIQTYITYSLPCSSEEKMTEEKYKKHNYVVIKEDKDIEGYSIDVEKSDYNEENQKIVIKGHDAVDLIYAAHDFRNKYIPYARTCYGDKIIDYFHKVFNEPIKEYHFSSKPRIKNRGLWTWGYCIYDYRRYIDNMVKLKLNTLTIWNDFVPLNYKEIISYAHENGVKIYLGFPWGWESDCSAIEKLQDIDTMVDTIEKIYTESYKDIECDGIYFQTFTEIKGDEIGGVSVAHAAVELVNKTAEKILNIKPDLKVQFGLHATSVKHKLEVISKVDERIAIVWEDCGAFPYEYLPNNIDGFEDTIKFTDKIRDLRNADFGVVLKGFTYLDWFRFEHQTGEFILGKNHTESIKKRAEGMHEVWKFIQAYWIRNADKVQETMKHFNENTVVSYLLEDGCFEERIPYPVAIAAELLWDSNCELNNILCDAALREDVTMMN